MPDDTIQYGKRVGDLQSGITIDRERVLHGTSHFVKDYKEFSDNVEEQSGNYVAMKLPDSETCEITSASGTKSLPPEDRDLVWRVKDNEATLKVKTPEREETYSASGLVLEKGPMAAVATVIQGTERAAVYTNIPQAENVMEAKEDGGSAADAERTVVEAVSGAPLSDTIDIVDGHFDESSLMRLTKAELLALSDDMGLATNKRMSKKELAARISGVSLDAGEDVSDGEAPPDLNMEAPVV